MLPQIYVPRPLFSPLTNGGGRLELWLRPYLGDGMEWNTAGDVTLLRDYSGRGRHLLPKGGDPLQSGLVSSSGLGGNLLYWSTDLTQATAWGSVTAWRHYLGNSVATAVDTVQINGGNGYWYQEVPTLPGKTYTVKLTARILSKGTGANTWRLMHANSQDGDGTYISLSTGWQTFSVTVRGHAGWLNDIRAGGLQYLGSDVPAVVQVAEVSVRDSGWAFEYVPTSGRPIRPGVSYGRTLSIGRGQNRSAICQMQSPDFGYVSPFTAYLLVRPQFNSDWSEFLCDGTTLNSAGINASGSSYNFSTFGGTCNLSGMAQWEYLRPIVFTLFCGQSASYEAGIECFQEGTWFSNTVAGSARSPGSFRLGGRGDTGTQCLNAEIFEVVVRSCLDDIATRRRYQQYLARVGGVG